MSRPRAADDFDAIRSRMEELRREREWVRQKPRDELFDRSRPEYRHPVRQSVLGRSGFEIGPLVGSRRGD